MSIVKAGRFYCDDWEDYKKLVETVTRMFFRGGMNDKIEYKLYLMNSTAYGYWNTMDIDRRLDAFGCSLHTYCGNQSVIDSPDCETIIMPFTLPKDWGKNNMARVEWTDESYRSLIDKMLDFVKNSEIKPPKDFETCNEMTGRPTWYRGEEMYGEGYFLEYEGNGILYLGKRALYYSK